MLNIYTDINAIGTQKKLVYDVNLYFKALNFDKTDYIVNVLHKVEEATWIGHRGVKDRFGDIISLDDISTSSKILLILSKHDKNIVVNISEIGEYALTFIPDNCSVYTNREDIQFTFDKNIPVRYNNIPMDIDEANYQLLIMGE